MPKPRTARSDQYSSTHALGWHLALQDPSPVLKLLRDAPFAFQPPPTLQRAAYAQLLARDVPAATTPRHLRQKTSMALQDKQVMLG